MDQMLFVKDSVTKRAMTLMKKAPAPLFPCGLCNVNITVSPLDCRTPTFQFEVLLKSERIRSVLFVDAHFGMQLAPLWLLGLCLGSWLWWLWSSRDLRYSMISQCDFDVG